MFCLYCVMHIVRCTLCHGVRMRMRSHTHTQSNHVVLCLIYGWIFFCFIRHVRYNILWKSLCINPVRFFWFWVWFLVWDSVHFSVVVWCFELVAAFLFIWPQCHWWRNISDKNVSFQKLSIEIAQLRSLNWCVFDTKNEHEYQAQKIAIGPKCVTAFDFEICLTSFRFHAAAREGWIESERDLSCQIGIVYCRPFGWKC